MHTRTTAATAIALAITAHTLAQPALIVAPTTIGPTDTTIIDSVSGLAIPLATAQVTVRNTTLTMNGRHTIASLVLEAGTPAAVLTHTANTTFDYSGDGADIVPGLELTITGNAVIQGPGPGLSAATINLNGRGHPAGAGPGGGQSNFEGAGGSHGGAGGNALNATAGPTYGSVTTPSQLGSGGGNDINAGGTSGGAGGGRIRLAVGGTLTLDGDISASGNSSITTTTPGGGAGGSIFISAAAVSGAGTIAATGGSGWSVGGEGGGGRIAVVATTSTLPEINIAANGAAGGQTAGAGSIYVDVNGETPRLIFDNANGSNPVAITEISGETTFDADVVVRNGAIVGPPLAHDGLHLTINGDLTIDASSMIACDARGFAAGAGPGAGRTNFEASGAGHGGAGGFNTRRAEGVTYGSFTQPTTMGSGGGNDINVGGASGGRGGGAIRLTVNGDTTVDGAISANGAPSGTSGTPGGGAGGSLWITTDRLTGAGEIRANGAVGWSIGGEGGGGRIAIETPDWDFDDTRVDAYGGAGAQNGGAGTVYLVRNGAATLIVDNGGTTPSDGITELTGAVTVDGDLVVRNQGRLGPRWLDDTLHFTITGDATIATDGAITADGRGHAAGEGPGAGRTNFEGTGAGHGGAGGFNLRRSEGGTYGDFLEPTELGSGGGNDVNVAGVSGGSGGGAIRMTIGGALHIDGAISADGLSSGTSGTPGGGAGGSIWIDTGDLTGAGEIRAHGAVGWSIGGEGGGGRIAVYADDSTFDDTRISAYGGDGPQSGGAGTVVFKPSAADDLALIVDNGGRAFTEAITEMTGDVAIPGNLIVRNAGHLGPHWEDTTLHLIVDGDITVESDGHIDADRRGFNAGAGPGGGRNSFDGGGAGHGGAGGPPNGPLDGLPYGSATAPTELGSGGGNDVNIGGVTGGPGGGVIRLTADTIRVDGRISADGGDSGTSGTPGGGSGGSLWLTTPTLSGTGLITATGGAGWSIGGEGAGGRIAVYSCLTLLPESNLTAAAAAGPQTAEDGTVILTTTDGEVEPVVEALCTGDTARFAALAGGVGTLQFQWRRNGEPLTDGPQPTGSTISGATAQELVVENFTLFDSGSYDVVITADCGTGTSDSIFAQVCGADVDCSGGIDGDDIAAFFADWLIGDGDIDNSGGTDGDDITFFFERWQSGC